MATFLSKIFKPKWQSSNKETRKQALAKLDSLNKDDHPILVQLAEQDPSPEIRFAAIEKISDADTLISLHKRAQENLRPVVEQRLYTLAKSQSLSIFDLIIDLDILSEMIIKATQADSYISGLGRIQDSPALLKIAMQARNAQIRQAAAELIETENDLNTLYEHAKNKDKTVFQITKLKLARLKELAQMHQANQTKIEKILKDLEALSVTEALQHFDVRLAHTIKRWSEVNQHASASQAEDYTRRVTACEQKLQKLQEHAAATQADAEITPSEETANTEEQSTLIDERQLTLGILNETLSRFKTQPASIQDISALDALIKTQENRWIEATADHEASKAELKSYQETTGLLKHYLTALRSLKEQAATLQAMLPQLSDSTPTNRVSEAAASAEKTADKTSLLSQQLKTRQQLKKLLAKLDWPAMFAKPELLLDAEDLLQQTEKLKQIQAEQQKRSEQKIMALLEDMDQAIEEKQIKPAAKHLKAIQHELKALHPQYANKLQASISLRSHQLNDLRDWQGFASSPKQEELCEAMEKLAETHIDPQDKADKIKAMQLEWKALGGSGDKAMWERFKTAADKAFEPCALFFAEQQQLKETNLKKRQMLVEQLQTYLESIDWPAASSRHPQTIWTHSDWKTADKIHRQARQEWKDAFPVDFKACKPLQQSFNQLISQFEQLLEDEKAYNLSLKQTIVDQANALKEEADIHQAIQQAKQLQEAWQKIGITHHKEDKKLWAAYRSACDAVFERRNELREAQRSETDAAIQQAQQICEAIEASQKDLSTMNETQLSSLAAEHRKSLQTLPKLPNPVQEKISQRIQTVLKRIDEAQQKLTQQARINAWNEAARKAALIRKRYQALTTTSEAEQTEQAQHDDEFLSATTLPVSLEKALDLNWQHLKQKQFESLTIIDEEQARTLCIRCEIAAGIDSPESDKALRMQLQVNRLSEGLSNGAEKNDPLDELESILSLWYQSVGLTAEQANTFEARIEKAKAALLGA